MNWVMAFGVILGSTYNGKNVSSVKAADSINISPGIFWIPRRKSMMLFWHSIFAMILAQDLLHIYWPTCWQANDQLIAPTWILGKFHGLRGLWRESLGKMYQWHDGVRIPATLLNKAPVGVGKRFWPRTKAVLSATCRYVFFHSRGLWYHRHPRDRKQLKDLGHLGYLGYLGYLRNLGYWEWGPSFYSQGGPSRLSVRVFRPSHHFFQATNFPSTKILVPEFPFSWHGSLPKSA